MLNCANRNRDSEGEPPFSFRLERVQASVALIYFDLYLRNDLNDRDETKQDYRLNKWKFDHKKKIGTFAKVF